MSIITHDVLIESLNKVVQQELIKSIPGMIPGLVGKIVDSVDRDIKDEIKLACMKNINRIFESREFEMYVKKSFDLEVKNAIRQMVDKATKKQF